MAVPPGYFTNYTTTRDFRELQRPSRRTLPPPHYTTTRDFRELQRRLTAYGGWLIIPQQETSGNYNLPQCVPKCLVIIPQQETSGNYNVLNAVIVVGQIIPQQETSGNYNVNIHTVFGISPAAPPPWPPPAAPPQGSPAIRRLRLPTGSASTGYWRR